MNAKYDYRAGNKKPLPSKKDKFFGDPYGQGLDSVVKICIGIAAVLLLISVILIVSSQGRSKSNDSKEISSTEAQEVVIVEENMDDPVQLIDP